MCKIMRPWSALYRQRGVGIGEMEDSAIKCILPEPVTAIILVFIPAIGDLRYLYCYLTSV
jgi:hypothetical protein